MIVARVIDNLQSSVLTNGRLNQLNTELTEPDRSGNIYRTEPDHTEPNLTAYKFSIIPSLKGSKNFEILKIKWFLKNIPEIWPKIAQIA